MIARSNQTSQPRVPLTVEGVPDSLRRRPRWVCWRYEEREGKPAKVPYDPTTGKRASSTDSGTWTTFEHALEAHRSGGYDGVSYAFGTDLDVVGVDLDDCRDPETGVITSWATEIIRALDSYAEISPSGTGVKLFLAGTKSIERCRKKVENGEVEIYDRKRFFTVTGRHLDGTPKTVEPRQAQLDALCQRLWPPEAPRPVVNAPKSTLELDDQALLDRARAAKNGDAFQRLWRGDTSGYGDDDSAADLALCGHLAFWTGCDASRMDRLFRQSGLFRGKWDEKRGLTTYGQRTIRKAIDGCREVYDREHGGSRKRTNPHQRRAALLTDIGNAARLVVKYGDRVRYCHPLKRWFIWDGKRWQRDDRGRIVRLCKKVALGILDEAKQARDKDREPIMNWARTSQRRDRLAAMAALAQPDVAVMPDELDADRWRFNCLNGTIDLRTGNLHPHNPDDLMTKVAPVEFDPEATCPRFEQFLGETFGGDVELIECVQRWQGHSLTGDISEQHLVIYFGAGNNGKSVLLDTIAGLMGPYAAEAPPDLLTVRKHPEHPTEIADLLGRRLVIASETEKDAKLRLQLIKRLTGNARLKGRHMREDYFEFDRTHKLILVTNNLPSVEEDTEAVWRRLIVVPFDQVIPEAQRDRSLLQTLEKEWPGILAWLVRGCLTWQKEGLNPPHTVAMATRQFRSEANSLMAFLDECCVLGGEAFTPSSQLGAAYEQWCKDNERRPVKAGAFGKTLRTLGCRDERPQGKRGWVGVQLKDTACQIYRICQQSSVAQRNGPFKALNGKSVSNPSNVSETLDSSPETQIPEEGSWSV